jgi:hypothetical protein
LSDVVPVRANPTPITRSIASSLRLAPDGAELVDLGCFGVVHVGVDDAAVRRDRLRHLVGQRTAGVSPSRQAWLRAGTLTNIQGQRPTSVKRNDPIGRVFAGSLGLMQPA